MNSFWTVSLFWASFFVLIAAALAFVLPPLLRRGAKVAQLDSKEVNIAIYHDQLAELKADLENGELDQSQYQDALREIEKRLSEDVPPEPVAEAAGQTGRWAGFALALAVPVLAVAIYMFLGNPDGLLPQAATPAPAAQGGAHDAAPMIAALEAKLQSNPEDPQGWSMLGRSYAATGRFPDAAKALSKAAELAPNDPRILAEYAESLAMAQGQNLQGKPLELINQALKLDDKDQKALELAGAAAYQTGDYAKAASYWRRLLDQVPPGTEDHQQILAAVQEAEQAAKGAPGLDNLSAQNQGKPAPPAAQPGADFVSGTITVSKEIAAKVSPTDTVFIFAQLPKGPRMPVASVKISARDLPYQFKLDDSATLMPDNKLSSHPEVVIGARISKRGEAMPASGDLQGKTGPVKLGQSGVSVVIDTVLP